MTGTLISRPLNIVTHGLIIATLVGVGGVSVYRLWNGEPDPLHYGIVSVTESEPMWHVQWLPAVQTDARSADRDDTRHVARLPADWSMGRQSCGVGGHYDRNGFCRYTRAEQERNRRHAELYPFCPPERDECWR